MENVYTEEERYWMTGGNTGLLPTRITPSKVNQLGKGEIFVFGSNFEGRHLSGAAHAAKERYGAIWGAGEGLQGQSYAIPTMEGLENLRSAVERFTSFARQHTELRFYVTAIGCGIAGHSPEDVAPMFLGAAFLKNVNLPLTFWKVIMNISEGEEEVKQLADSIIYIYRYMHRYGEMEWASSHASEAIFQGLDRHQMWVLGVKLGIIAETEEEPPTKALPKGLRDRIYEAIIQLV